MDLNRYQEVFENFLEKRDQHPEEQGRKVPNDINKLVIGGIKTVKAAILVFDLADSKKTLEELGKEKYLEWLGLALHCFFHCVDDFDGSIDKYTGDGAMVSFSLGSKEERCQNSLECALKISEILNKILNPYYLKRNYYEMNIRIGIDFGPIKTEKIGKKAKSQLIITGSPANTAKILEEKGKDLNNFYQNSKICFGYDILYNLSENDIRNSEGSYLYRNIGSLSNTTSYMDKSKPYKIYEYTGRFYVRE